MNLIPETDARHLHTAAIHLTACEIDADYYEAATARIAREISQTTLNL